MNWWILRRHIHVSWVIACTCGGILIGVVVAQYMLPGQFASLLWLGAGVVLICFSFLKSRIGVVLLAIIGGVLIGLWRGSADQQNLEPYKNIHGHEVVLSGRVSEDVDIAKDGSTNIRLDDVIVNGHPLSGKVWMSSHSAVELKRSDTVTAEGVLGEGFGNFSATMYRAVLKKVERPQPGDVALMIRDWFAGLVRKSIPEPQASLGIGYLVGQRRSLPPQLDDALKTAGLTHIVVASGYNLTILVRLARRLFEKVSKYLSVLASGSMIAAFMAITGLSPSMSRAGLVAGLSLLAWYYGRKFHPLVLLPFAAAVTVIIRPDYAWGDLGWQLSFASFAGVMLLAPLFQAYFFGPKKPGTIRQILGETMSAQIATLPIIVLAFGQFSNVAIIANILVLPLVPLAMLLTFIAGIGSLLLPGMAMAIGAPASWLLQYMTTVAQYVAGLPWAVNHLAISVSAVVLFYGMLIAAALYAWRKTRFDLRNANLVE